MKTRRLVTILAVTGIAFLFASCSDEVSSIDETDVIINAVKCAESETTFGDSCNFTGTLTEAEIEGLMEMREEEKLAQDVYLYFYDLYKTPVFKNISKAEAAHTKAVLWLINGYGLEDPLLEGLGNFTNPAFTELYKQLTEKGSESVIEALKVGAFIEEYDINDLLNLMEKTESDNITRVYGNLLRGSEFHIKAFTNLLKLNDVIYSPIILNEELYQEIINK